MQTQPHPTFAKLMIGAVLALGIGAPSAAAASEAPNFPQAVPSQPGEVTSSSAAAESARAQERYYTSYGHPSSVSPSSSVPADTGGVDWTSIGISVGATIILVGAVIALVMRTRRRTANVRVAA